jgi:uncharacterized protein HemX
MLSELVGLIPVQYRLAAGLIVAAAVIGGAFGAGWTVQGWRLGNKVTTLQADLKTCQGNQEALSASVETQNEKVEKWRRRARERAQAAQQAQEQARQRVSALEKDLEALRRARPETCAEAEALIDRELGL